MSLLSVPCSAWVVLAAVVPLGNAAAEEFSILAPAAFEHHVGKFNTMEDENVANFVPNSASWDWLRANIPLFECSDPEVEEIYYFRWWSFRKHLIRLPQGFALTEFITKPNPISSAVGHHLMEGRWLRDRRYLDDDARYWLRGNSGGLSPDLHKFSGWLEDALYQRFLADGNRDFVISLLDDMIGDYRQWEKERLQPSGLFWQYDVRDAMEESISGSRTKKNLRPPLNSYMYGNARAIAAVARLAGRNEVARQFDAAAVALKEAVQRILWNPAAEFFEVREEDGSFSGAREEIGFIPWYFHLPDPADDAAWAQFSDPAGFHAPRGITTAERRHPLFRAHAVGHSEWDGAVWPFATSQTLTALANVLRDYPPSAVTSQDYFSAFLTYVHSQHYDGLPYIGEYLDEKDGHWIRGRLERSRYYNHSRPLRTWSSPGSPDWSRETTTWSPSIPCCRPGPGTGFAWMAFPTMAIGWPFSGIAPGTAIAGNLV